MQNNQNDPDFVALHGDIDMNRAKTIEAFALI